VRESALPVINTVLRSLTFWFCAIATLENTTAMAIGVNTNFLGFTFSTLQKHYVRGKRFCLPHHRMVIADATSHQAVNGRRPQTAERSERKCRRSARRKRRSSDRRNVRRCNRLQGMRQRGEFFEMNGRRCRRCRHRGTQWTVHVGRSFELLAITTCVHHLHHATRRANHLQVARLDDGRSNGRTQKKRKPNQHEFGDEFGATQGLHSVIMTNVD